MPSALHWHHPIWSFCLLFLILILILITSFRHSWVKGNANCDMKHSMRALLQGEALASRDVMPSSFYSTVPKSCSHWSSLLLGTTLEHTKTLWTLCPTKLMAFCKIGPSKRSSNKHRIFCCSSRTPLGGSGLCGQSRMACRTEINLAKQKGHSSSTSTLDSGS